MGKISATDIKRLAKELGENVTDREIQEIVHEADQNIIDEPPIDAEQDNVESFDLKSEPDIVEPVVEEVDFAKYFITDKKFTVRDDLLAWVRCEAAKLGFSIIIKKSDHGSDRRKQFFILGCERGGVYRQTNTKLKRKKTVSKKCDCPFRLRGYFLATKEWNLTVVCGKHNHEITPNLEGHLVVGRLNAEEKELVGKMTMNNVMPKNILLTLKNNRSENIATLKQVYNARHRFKKSIRSSGAGLNSIHCEEPHPDVSVLTLSEMIQKQFNEADYNTKLHIKEQLLKIAFPDVIEPTC